jgi:transcription antitermination factor NusG
MTQKKLHIKKGDNVMVISGDYKGTQGKVLEVESSKYRALLKELLWYQSIPALMPKTLRVVSLKKNHLLTFRT